MYSILSEMLRLLRSRNSQSIGIRENAKEFYAS